MSHALPTLLLLLSLSSGVLGVSWSVVIAQEASPVASATGGAADPVAERVDVGGRSLFLACAGEGSPTVILEAGRFPAGEWEYDFP